MLTLIKNPFTFLHYGSNHDINFFTNDTPVTMAILNIGLDPSLFIDYNLQMNSNTKPQWQLIKITTTTFALQNISSKQYLAITEDPSQSINDGILQPSPFEWSLLELKLNSSTPERDYSATGPPVLIKDIKPDGIYALYSDTKPDPVYTNGVQKTYRYYLVNYESQLKAFNSTDGTYIAPGGLSGGYAWQFEISAVVI